MKYELGNLELFQSLFYWITYSYTVLLTIWIGGQTVSILILLDYLFLYYGESSVFYDINVVSILILLDYLFL